MDMYRCLIYKVSQIRLFAGACMCDGLADLGIIEMHQINYNISLQSHKITAQMYGRFKGNLVVFKSTTPPLKRFARRVPTPRIQTMDASSRVQEQVQIPTPIPASNPFTTVKTNVVVKDALRP